MVNAPSAPPTELAQSATEASSSLPLPQKLGMDDNTNLAAEKSGGKKGCLEFGLGWKEIESDGVKVVYDHLKKIRNVISVIHQFEKEQNLFRSETPPIYPPEIKTMIDDLGPQTKEAAAEGPFDPLNYLSWPPSIVTAAQKMKLYTIVYTMGSQKDSHTGAIYTNYNTALLHFLDHTVVGKLSASVFETETDFLIAVLDKWNEFRYFMKECKIFLQYLERYHIQISHVESLDKLAIRLFQERVMGEFSTRVLNAVVNLFDEDRTYWISKSENEIDPKLSAEAIAARSVEPSSMDVDSDGGDVEMRRVGSTNGTNFGFKFINGQDGIENESVDDISAIKKIAEEVYKPCVNSGIVKLIVQMIIDFQEENVNSMYNLEFRPRILNCTKEFYQHLSSLWIPSKSFPNYFLSSAVCLQLEFQRGLSMLLEQQNLHEILVESAHGQLLGSSAAEHLFSPVTNSVEVCLSTDRFLDLSRAFALLEQPGTELRPFATAFKMFVIEQGMKIINAKAEALKSHTAPPFNMASINTIITSPELCDSKFVDELISLHSKHRAVKNLVFKNHFLFSRALKEAFEEFLNKLPDNLHFPISAFLVAYINKILRTTVVSSLNSTVNDKPVFEATELFGYLTDNDSFSEGYKQALAKRLIDNPNSISPLEDVVVSQLKSKCGPQFAFKIEGMLKDMKDNIQINEQYSESDLLIDSRNNVTEMSFQILTTSYWPPYKPIPIRFPLAIQGRMDAFEKFYTQTLTQHRKIVWMPSLSTVVLSAEFKGQIYEVLCTSIQAIVMDTFNLCREDKKYLLYSEIAEISKLDEQILKKSLKSLYGGKYPLILRPSCLPDGSPLPTGNAAFVINEDFSCTHSRFKLPLPFVEESSLKDRIQQDKSDAIQAAIVSTMKKNRDMQHNALVAEVVKKLAPTGFIPDNNGIKNHVDNLIAKEYLSSSDEPQPNTYTYVP